MSQWSPDFNSSIAKVDKTLVWIWIPGMNLVYYDESLLLAMASVVGRPIKVDENTLRVERGRFARVCLEINLNQPVVGKIWVRDNWYKIEYEGLHVICSICGCYGHVSRNCSIPPMTIVQEGPKDPCTGGVADSSILNGEITGVITSENIAKEDNGDNVITGQLPKH